MNDIKVKILDTEDKEVWNRFVNLSPWGDVLQMWQWGELKRQEGWRPLRLAVIQNKQLILTCQLLLKPVPMLGNYAYAPHGPVFHSVAGLKVALPVLIDYIASQAAKTYDLASLEIEPKIGFPVENTLAYADFFKKTDSDLTAKKNLESDSGLESELNSEEKMSLEDDLPAEKLQLTHIPDPLPYYFDPEIIATFWENGFFKTGRNMQPKHKLFYDLNQPEEKLLESCHKTTRYNVRYAEKHDVKIREYYPDHPDLENKLDVFYDLVLETQQRAKGYPVRSRESFSKLFEEFKGTKNLVLTEALVEGQTVVMNISQRTKYWSSSFYAGSNRLHPKAKAPYLLRWKSIQSAKLFGSKTYDFWGIIPASSQHKGYSDHKLSFGGYRLDTYGLLAMPLNPIKYNLWNTGIWLRTEGVKSLRQMLWQGQTKTKNVLVELSKKAVELLQKAKSKTEELSSSTKPKMNKSERNEKVAANQSKVEEVEKLSEETSGDSNVKVSENEADNFHIAGLKNGEAPSSTSGMEFKANGKTKPTVIANTSKNSSKENSGDDQKL